MINESIKIDLHIHSFKSFYKDGKIVKESTKENLDVLLTKLIEHEIKLFSITDHNRFDSDLYIELKNKINKDEKYKNLNFIPGIEFNLKLEEFDESKAGQINIYFNASSEEEFIHIENIINSDEFFKENKVDFFSKEEIEKLIYKIGFDVILIASQTKGLHFEGNGGKVSALSDHTKDSKKWIQSGYISALEFQKPRVEGILKNNLRDLNNFALITFSDCHEWAVYPKHDSSSKLTQKNFTKIKSLPTFKGLMYAFSSPKTRINRIESSNTNWIREIKLNDKIIKLDRSINVITGNNGSGKTAILSKIINDTNKLKNEYSTIFLNNSLEFNGENSISFKIIKQNEIIDKKFALSNLFENIEHDKDDSEFKHKMETYTNRINNNFRHFLSIKESLNKIYSTEIEFVEKNDHYFIQCSNDLENIEENKYNKIVKNINKIIQGYNGLIEDLTFKADKTSYNLIVKNNENILLILEKYNNLKNELDQKNKIINKIISIFNRINSNNSNKSSSAEQNRKNYETKKQELISEFKKIIKLKSKEIKVEEFPIFSNGISEIKKNGFIFKSIPKYSKNISENDFYSVVFNKEVSNQDELYKLKSNQDFFNSLKKTSNSHGLRADEIFKKNCENFISKQIERSEIILETDNENLIGSTPGQAANAFIKFFLQENISNNDIILIDQPEDNISNLNISLDIIALINSMRDEKQFIIVTHNPIIVTNLDIDNLVFLENNNGQISSKNGCLEYDGEWNIIKIVIDNMEGGLEAVKNRMDIYKYEKN
ncbi:PHP domain-containing protein [Spiroplasma monobiae]|uniref:Polymerase/histidinol phosphatase N-terminal domain-containing protein n=1 Tax=Spiroplasma monobiae MQ-1 TaxID=1336748 RepID=A0A2K9LU75_SPISQ|nr:PHP domain-containing protein [Spiroplasma monobiae]AUM62608.1 hypothetical protein SMONO_v1c03590 [Spiroplasma monobiae MQ-1]